MNDRDGKISYRGCYDARFEHAMQRAEFLMKLGKGSRKKLTRAEKNTVNQTRPKRIVW